MDGSAVTSTLGSASERELDLIDHSYDLVVARLTRAQQNELRARP
ncbi:MmcQ/YjbR family DNA-binding protein [Nonomuraea turcica]|nr:hypothetical protein [Nonomuraea sp. G32]MDP4507904.1 hypothetical protein [Nonomuraea sp. G32]